MDGFNFELKLVIVLYVIELRSSLVASYFTTGLIFVTNDGICASDGEVDLQSYSLSFAFLVYLVVINLFTGLSKWLYLKALLFDP